MKCHVNANGVILHSIGVQRQIIQYVEIRFAPSVITSKYEKCERNYECIVSVCCSNRIWVEKYGHCKKLPITAPVARGSSSCHRFRIRVVNTRLFQLPTTIRMPINVAVKHIVLFTMLQSFLGIPEE